MRSSSKGSIGSATPPSRTTRSFFRTRGSLGSGRARPDAPRNTLVRGDERPRRTGGTGPSAARTPPVRIAWKGLLAYLFALFLVYLAGYFVTRLFSFLYLVLLVLPLLELLQVVVTLIRFRLFQNFDNEHPVKGEAISYRLALANESPLPSAVVTLRFKTVHPEMALVLHDLRRTFGGNETLERRFSIRCPYRGIYTVGLESVSVGALSGWIEITRSAYHRTFYVYPRIIDLEPPFVGSRAEEASGAVSSGTEVDRSLFEGLASYRPGLPVKDLAWRRFLSTGIPFLKEYRRSSDPGITIYLDLRREEPVSPLLLEREDCSVEVVVALVRYFTGREVPVSVRAVARGLYDFHSGRGERFAEFHRDTINLLFGPFPSPVGLFSVDRRGDAAGGSVLFVTHLLDPELLDLITSSESRPVGAVVNLHGLTAEERGRYDPHLNAVRERGGRLIVVESAETIRKDIEG